MTASYKNNSITLPNATRAGYQFAGWYTSASGGSRVGGNDSSYTPTATTTLYAHWIDETDPVISSLTQTPTKWTNGNVTLTGVAQDSQSGLSYYQFSQNGNITASSSGWTSITNTTSKKSFTHTVSNNGTYYFYVKDAEGNVSSKSIKVTNIDKEAPNITDMYRVSLREDEDSLFAHFSGTNNTGSGHSNSTTTWKNLVSNSFNGTLKNGATWTSDGLVLDGSDDWVALEYKPLTEYALEVTFIADKVSGRTNVLGNWDAGGCGIYIENGVLKSDYYCAEVGDYNRQSANISIEAGKEYTVLVSFDKNHYKIFINDTLAYNVGMGGTVGTPANSTIWAIGCNPTGSVAADGERFDGTIKEIKMYSKGLVDYFRFADTMPVEVKASDSQSGIKEYRFYANNTLKGTVETSEAKCFYTYTGLSPLVSYNLKVEVVDNAGNVEEKQITEVISNVLIAENITRTSFDLIFYTNKSNVTKVEMPTWTIRGGQDDVCWYNATKQREGVWKVTVPVSDHFFEGGYYITHVYVTANGTRTNDYGKYDTLVPDSSYIGITNLNREGFDVNYYTSRTNVSAASIAVWTPYNGQDEIKWDAGTKVANRTYTIHVSVSDHLYEGGTYNVHAYATVNGSSVYDSGNSAEVPNTDYYAIKNITDSGYKVVFYTSNTSVTKAQLATWSDYNGQDDLTWQDMNKTGPRSYELTVNKIDHKNDGGLYNSHIYARDSANNAVSVYVLTTTLSGGVGEHTHVYNARTAESYSVPTWTCTHGHTQSRAYRICCSICGAWKTTSPTYSCTIAPDLPPYTGP